MRDFVAIDFETANSEPTSICSIGLVVVRNGEICDTFYSLVQPEPNYYSYWNTRTHGLTHADTDQALVFPFVWSIADNMIKDLPLVAHNKAFDEKCLRAAFRCYRMDYPEYPFYCTLIESRRHFPKARNHRLDTIASLCGYTLSNHHHALSDAEACAWIAREIL